MLTVIDYARIRYGYYIEKKSMKELEREWGHSYWTIRKALDEPEPTPNGCGGRPSRCGPCGLTSPTTGEKTFDVLARMAARRGVLTERNR